MSFLTRWQRFDVAADSWLWLPYALFMIVLIEILKRVSK